MSNFPSNFDDDTTLPFVNNNLTEIGGEAINAARDAIFNIETEIGLGASGTAGSIAKRLGISLLPSGAINPSALTGLGLVTLPITNNQIADNANIPESKLLLDYRTSDLFNYIRDSANHIDVIAGWVSISGMKLEPHIGGAIYRHNLTHIDVNADPNKYLKNKYRLYRDNSDSYQLISGMNTELLDHQFADGYHVTSGTVITNSGASYPADYAHTASGIFLNTNRFAVIPETTTDLQTFAQFIDDSSIFLYGTRIQNLYSNGISKVSRSAKLGSQTVGQSIVPTTSVKTYLLGNTGSSSSPVDNINYGDDIIEFFPDVGVTASFKFDSQFSLVKPGDIIRVTYKAYNGHGAVEVPFLVKEKKFISGSPSKYIIRIAGKNLYYSPEGYATARIDKPLFNNNKFGVLATSLVNHNMATSIMPSLIVGSPRNAMVLGIGFDPDLLDSDHYLLYIALYPTGHPEDGYVILPPIDVTGNAGATPGLYTLESVVDATNAQFRKAGYNYRFMAFSYQGEFGIMMTDCYNNAAFSILDAIVDNNGNYDETETNIAFNKNVIGMFAASPLVPPDPLGFGGTRAAISSPPYKSSYGSTEAAQIATKIFIPVTRANYYVNGTEKDKLSLEEGQLLDGYGDSYWLATIIGRVPTPGIRVATTYRIDGVDLSHTKLKEGKTLVIQSAGSGTIRDYGRYIIESISFGCSPDVYTDITVYDSIHAAGFSPASSSNSGQFALYFNSDSVSFNNETATDNDVYSSFKRHFEVYIDENSNTFTHERGRIHISGGTTVNGVTIRSTSELAKLEIIRISPKLRGYQFGSVTKISLRILSFEETGDFSGYLVSYDGSNYTNYGPTIHGRIGEVTRFYDETNIDYIDILFDTNTEFLLPITDQLIDFQLFPSLASDDEIMLIATCQHNSVTGKLTQLRDERQFGNVSEKEFSTSALNYISLPDKLLHQNGIIKGFDLQTVLVGTNPNDNQIYMKGGVALVGGKIIYKNHETVAIPKIQEYFGRDTVGINWALCVNDRGEYQPIPLLDYDAINGTPNEDRIFKAYNPLNLQKYNLDAEYFSDIVNNRKDLTLVYVVHSKVEVVGGVATSTLTMYDVRKYVTDVDANLPLRYNAGDGQSNFKNVSAIFNWLSYNSSFNGQVVIKGAMVTGTEPHGPIVSEDLRLGTNDRGTIVIDGNGDASIEFTGTITIGSNVTFQNINLYFTDYVMFDYACSHLKFENCNITFAPTTARTDNTMIFLNAATSVIFKDSTITAIYPTQTDSGGTVFNFTNCSDFQFLNSSLNAVYAPTAGVYYPGDVFTFDATTKTRIINSQFTGNFNRLIKYSDTSDDSIVSNCKITSTFNPSSYTSGILSYNTANFVNAGNVVDGSFGYIQASVATNLQDITIENTIFNYSPTSESADRFSFINFDLTTNQSVLENVKINNCRFNDTNIPASIDSIRAVIAIVNIAPAVTSYYLPQPMLRGISITDNVCNKNQSIIVTSKTDGDGYMQLPGLQAENCHISNNICGVIGYWTSLGSKYLNIAPFTNELNDKGPNLLIDGNTCHYIASMDYKGKYFSPTKKISGITTNMSVYVSGLVTISNNHANWIHTGLSFETNNFLKIIGNNLTGYDSTFLEQFGESASDIEGKINYAITVIGNKYNSAYNFGNGGNCLISGNTIDAGWISATDMTTLYYDLYNGGIYCRTSSIITNNIIKGVDGYKDGIHAYPMIGIGGKVNTCTNNQLYRNGAGIGSYIGWVNGETPEWLGLIGSSGIITENYLDSVFVDKSNTIDDVFALPYTFSWIIERNINQTVTRNFSFNYGQFTWSSFLPFPSGAHRNFIGFPTGISIEKLHTIPNRLVLTYNGSITGGAMYYISSHLDLSTMIPENVKIRKLSVDVTPVDPPSSSGAYSIILTAQTYIPAPFSAPIEVTDTYIVPSGGGQRTLSISDPFLLLYTNKQSGDIGYIYADITVMTQDDSSTMKTIIDQLQVKYVW